MALLRMLAFVPASAAATAVTTPGPTVKAAAITTAPIDKPSPPRAAMSLIVADDWLALVGNSGLKGPVRELASHCAFLGYDAGLLRLSLPDSCAHLRSDGLVRRLSEELASALGSAPQIKFENAAGEGDTLHGRQQRERSERQSSAEASFLADPVVGQLLGQGGNVVPDSIRPVD
jgi:DNA polymerase-3 subunit gamma/tau